MFVLLNSELYCHEGGLKSIKPSIPTTISFTYRFEVPIENTTISRVVFDLRFGTTGWKGPFWGLETHRAVRGAVRAPANLQKPETCTHLPAINTPTRSVTIESKRPTKTGMKTVFCPGPTPKPRPSWRSRRRPFVFAPHGLAPPLGRTPRRRMKK